MVRLQNYMSRICDVISVDVLPALRLFSSSAVSGCVTGHAGCTPLPPPKLPETAEVPFCFILELRLTAASR